MSRGPETPCGAVCAAIGLVAAAAALLSCSPAPEPAESVQPIDASWLKAALETSGEILLPKGEDSGDSPGPLIRQLDDARAVPAERAAIVVDYPLADSLFPPGFVPPTFLWHDADESADAWLVRVEFATGEPLIAIVAGGAPEQGWIDLRAQGTTNEVYVPTDEQASAESWTPSADVWSEIQRRSVETPVRVAFHGFVVARPDAVVSAGEVLFATSSDEVGAPIFYRDVPLMPAVSEKDGVIKPLSDEAVPIIEWRMRDVRLPESKVVLTGMPTCANCHSFSLDGKTFGMDVDGPTGDKGAYGIAPIEKRMELGAEQVITWNSFEGKPEGHKTIGFLTRVSPDGRHALTTLNEELYVSNFANYKFLQVFFPVGGILAWYSRETGEMKALPGADDKTYVHTNGVWTPDGKTVVFSRAKAFKSPDWEAARFPNDPREPQIRYGLYRIPFDEGRGGTPEPIEGATSDDWSHTFPKVSPDGKWVVFTRCKNGQLLRPDGKLCIVPAEGGESRVMRCNTDVMNSWHSFSPNGRWMVFTSKTNTPYTQMFLTHIDADGNDTPAILIPNSTAANRAVNLPEFLNAPYDAIEQIAVPATGHRPSEAYFGQAVTLMGQLRFEQAIPLLERSLGDDPGFLKARVNLAYSLWRSAQPSRAIEEYRRVLEAAPADPFARGSLELLRLGAGLETIDLEQERRAVAADPEDGEARGRLGLTLALDADFDAALTELDRALELRPGDFETRRVRMFVRLASGDARQAVSYMDALARDETDGVETLTLWAWQLAASQEAFLRNAEEAVKIATRACRKTKYRDPEALDALAAAFAGTGRFREATRMAKEAVRYSEKDRPSLARAIDARRALYEAGKHFVD